MVCVVVVVVVGLFESVDNVVSLQVFLYCVDCFVFVFLKERKTRRRTQLVNYKKLSKERIQFLFLCSHTHTQSENIKSQLHTHAHTHTESTERMLQQLPLHNSP